MVNDQLIQVNGNTLQGKSNTAAMDTLRKAMQKDGQASGKIHLVVARRPGAAFVPPSSNSSGLSTPSREVRISNSDYPQVETSHGEMENLNGSGGKESIDSNANKKDYVDMNRSEEGGDGEEGEESVESLRNRSYLKATEDSHSLLSNSPLKEQPIHMVNLFSVCHKIHCVHCTVS